MEELDCSYKEEHILDTKDEKTDDDAVKTPILDIQNYKFNENTEEKTDAENKLEQIMTKSDKIDKENNKTTEIADDDEAMILKLRLMKRLIRKIK